MGQAKSRTEVSKILESSASVLNETIQQNSSSINQNQSITIESINGEVDISNLDWRQFAQIDTKAIASNKSESELAAKISESFKTQAEAMAEALSFSNTETENLTKLTTKLAMKVANTFSQVCSQQSNQTQSINIGTVGPAGKLSIHALNWQQFAKNSIECTQNSVMQTKEFADVTTAVEASSKSESKGLLSGPFLLVIIIIAVIALVVLGGATMGMGTVKEILTKKEVWIAITAIVGLYLVGGMVTGCCWPFQKKQEKNKFCTLSQRRSLAAGFGYNSKPTNN
jgi:hypothetical protein